jgi:hypothetical protein
MSFFVLIEVLRSHKLCLLRSFWPAITGYYNWIPNIDDGLCSRFATLAPENAWTWRPILFTDGIQHLHGVLLNFWNQYNFDRLVPCLQAQCAGTFCCHTAVCSTCREDGELVFSWGMHLAGFYVFPSGSHSFTFNKSRSLVQTYSLINMTSAFLNHSTPLPSFQFCDVFWITHLPKCDSAWIPNNPQTKNHTFTNEVIDALNVGSGELIPHLDDLSPILKGMEGAFARGSRSISVTLRVASENRYHVYSFAKVKALVILLGVAWHDHNTGMYRSRFLNTSTTT